jgi:hypothetical protein
LDKFQAFLLQKEIKSGLLKIKLVIFGKDLKAGRTEERFSFGGREELSKWENLFAKLAY